MDGTSVPQPLLSQSQCERDDFARGQCISADNASSDDGRSTSDSDSECEHDSKNGPGTTIPHSHRPTTHDPNVSPYICASSVALCVAASVILESSLFSDFKVVTPPELRRVDVRQRLRVTEGHVSCEQSWSLNADDLRQIQDFEDLFVKL